MCVSIHLYKCQVKSNLHHFKRIAFCPFSLEKLDSCDMKAYMKRKQFTTTLKEDDLKRIKKLAIDLDRSVNDLLEEGIEYLLKKYEKRPK